MRVIVTGSTMWTNADVIRRELLKLPAGSTIIHGDCAGVDALAGAIAVELGFAVECWKKNQDDYQRYRNAAWKGLNERMLAAGAVLVLGFHSEWHIEGKARGTKHMFAIAAAVSVETRAFIA